MKKKKKPNAKKTKVMHIIGKSGARGSTLRPDKMKKIQSAKMLLYQRLLNITWKDKRKHT